MYSKVASLNFPKGGIPELQITEKKKIKIHNVQVRILIQGWAKKKYVTSVACDRNKFKGNWIKESSESVENCSLSSDFNRIVHLGGRGKKKRPKQLEPKTQLLFYSPKLGRH